MITMKMQGGLGNQMFQYATAYAIAKKLGVELALDISSYAYDRQRMFNLDLFRIDNKIVFDSKPTVVEKTLEYCPSLAEDGDVLSGYFQCEYYFKEYRDELLNIFMPRKPLPFGYEMYWNKIMKSNSVALTIRRGDYLFKQAYHGVMEGDYYRAALHYLLNHAPPQTYGLLDVFVFSDDIQWCKKNLMFPSYFSSMTFIENDMTVPGHVGREDADIFLMKHCRSHVLANSSFSWWGAWLSGSKDVVAPRKWYADPNIKNSIVPDRWQRL